MKSSWDGNDPQALKEFLYQLIYHAKRPEEVDLLLEAILSIQQMPRAAPNRLAEKIPIGHAMVRVGWLTAREVRHLPSLSSRRL
jgi:hypothetical protein